MPNDARVFVEAYRRFQWNRYDFGTVGSLGARENLDLGDLSYSESLSFRIFAKESNGRILALAENIKATEEEGITPLLPVELDDIGQVLWQLEFTDANGGPVLILNENVPDILSMATNDEQFILSVYPEIMRKVLARIIYVEENAKRIYDLPEGWQGDWIKLAKTIQPEKEPPEVIDPGDHDYRQGEVEDWLDEVREEFASKRSTEWRNFIDFMEGYGDYL